MTAIKPFYFLAFLFYLLSIAQVICAENPPVHADLVTETFSLEKGQGRLVFMVQMAKGWKVYASPEVQDTLAYPPEISWEGSKNLDKATLTWPYPKEYTENQEISHVYTEPFAVLVDITAKTLTQPVLLKGQIKILACSTTCLPLEIPFSLRLDHSIHAQKIHKIVETTLADKELAEEALSLPFILLLALAGGLILNIMPCVLPVLGLKFFFFSHQKKPIPQHLLRKNFLLTACGIYTSFFIFALTAILLKALDETVGWGIHFQNPYFLIAMIVGLSLFTANLWGLFEFNTPQWLGRFLNTTESLGGSAAFSSGVLATLLATPCSAPFVGTAVGFALARSPLDIFLVFSALALGFSAPYLLALVLPLEKIKIPKSGIWMVYVQRVLGFCLTGTVVWLLYLLEYHQSAHQFWATLLLMGAGVGFFLLSTYPKTGKALSFLCFFFIFIIPGVPHWFPALPFLKEPVPSPKGLLWHPLNMQRIDQFVQEGKTVFIDLTASWCITCQVNKKLVLQNKVVEDHLRAGDIVVMRGDWSKPNPEISFFLKKFGRAGIPFNVIIGPYAPKGVVLPEILTPDAVIHALQQASGF